MGHKNKRKVAVFGGTGLIGRSFIHSNDLSKLEISVFTRDVKRASVLFPESIRLYPFDESIKENLKEHEIIINLSGENISKRWTAKRKKKILDSRVSGTEKIVNAVNRLSKKPELFIQASATGYYPFSRDEVFNEESISGGSFLSEVVKSWESSVQKLDPVIRKVIVRTGVVITASGGMLPELIKPIKLFAGAVPGKGDNWLSWIHIDDIVGILSFLIKQKESTGIYNLTSPEPVRLKHLIRYCGFLLNRPVYFRIPQFLIKLFFGKMGEEMILSSQKVVPDRIVSEGYEFQFSKFEQALEQELI